MCINQQVNGYLKAICPRNDTLADQIRLTVE